MKDTYKLVVVHPDTRKWFEPRDVRADLDYDLDELREHLVKIAQSDSYLTTGAEHVWIGDFEARVYTEREHRKGAYDGGWATPEKVLRYDR